MSAAIRETILDLTVLDGTPSVTVEATELIEASTPGQRGAQGEPGADALGIRYNVKQAPYNAVGDGITDDTAAFRLWLADVSSGAVGYIPAGTYVLNVYPTDDANILTTLPGAHIMGEGHEVVTLKPRLASYAAVDWTTIPSRGARLFLLDSGTVFEGVTIDGRRDELDRSVIKPVRTILLRTLADTSDGVIRHVRVKNAYSQIRSVNITSIDTATEVLTATAHGFIVGDEIKIRLRTGGRAIIDGVDQNINNVLGTVLTVPTANTLTIDGWDFTVSGTGGNISTASDPSTEGFGVGIHDSNGWILDDVYSDDNDGSGISLGGDTYDSTYGGHHVRHCQTNGNAWQGITAWYDHDSVMSDSVANGNEKNGLNTEHCQRTRWVNCDREDNGYAGVMIIGASDSIVVDGGHSNNNSANSPYYGEIMLREANTVPNRGVPTNTSIHNPHFGSTILYHLVTRTDDAAVLSPTFPPAVIDAPDVLLWKRRVVTITGGVSAAEAANTYTGLYRFPKVPRSKPVLLPAIPAWLPTDSTITAAAYAGAGATSRNPVTVTVASAAEKKLSFRLSRTAAGFLVAGRVKLGTNDIWEVRVVGVTGSATMFGAQRLYGRTADSGTWFTFELPVAITDATQAVDVQIRALAGTNPRTLHIDYLDVYETDSGALNYEDDQTQALWLDLPDHFGTGASGSGLVGQLGWQLSTGAGLSMQTSQDYHPGIHRLSSNAVAGVYGVLKLSNSNLFLNPAWYFWSRWVFAQVTSFDANTTVRIGFGNDPNADPPADGIYLEKLPADTNYFFVTRASPSQTRVDTLQVANTNWRDVVMRRVDSTHVGFKIGTSAEVLFTATIPTVFLNPFWAIGNGAAAVAKTMDLDRFRLIVPTYGG